MVCISKAKTKVKVHKTAEKKDVFAKATSNWAAEESFLTETF